MNNSRDKPALKRVKKMVDHIQPIETALKKRTKAELIQFLVGFAKKSLEVRRSLENDLDIEKPVALLAHDIESAISTATDFDERDINRNFSFDYNAYEAVEKGLKDLVKQGQLDEAKRLSLELMRQGSYQVECSDEGMMTENIEACLNPVIQAVKKAGGEAVKTWARQMIAIDRVGFICEHELKPLTGNLK